MGAGRRSETHTGSHPPTLSPESTASFGSRFLYLTPQHLAGVIFGCTHATMKECLEGLVFGLPYPHIAYVQNVQPGMPLFLFNYTDRKLHGIFEAASHGEIDINPHGWTNKSAKTPYPAQVRVKVRQVCPPLPENVFKPAIVANYQSEIHFAFELDQTQTRKLMSLFTKNASRVEMNPHKMLTQKISQQKEEEESDGWIKPKKTIKSSKNAWHEPPPLVPSTQKLLSAQCVSTVAEHWEDICGNDVNLGLKNTHLESGVTCKWEDHEQIGYGWKEGEEKEIFPQREYMDNSLEREYMDNSESGVTCKWEDHEQIGYGWEEGEEKEIFPQREYMDNSLESSGKLPFDRTVRPYAGKENKEPTILEWEHRGVRKQQQQLCEKLETMWDAAVSSPESYVLSLVENDNQQHKKTHFEHENSQNMKAQNSYQNGTEIPTLHMIEQGQIPAVTSKYENWAEGRCVREQILQGEEHKRQRGSLQEMGSSVVNIVQTSLEASASAEMGSSMINVVQTSLESSAPANVLGQLASEIESLKASNGPNVTSIGGITAKQHVQQGLDCE